MAFGAALPVLLSLTLSCGGSGRPGEEIPSPALGSSRQAQVEFRALHYRWAEASRAERLAMEPELRSFRRRFPLDDQGRVADALLAWAALEKGDLDRAESLARDVQAKGAGTTRDLARTIEGAVLRRRGKPEEALTKLTPVVSKLIDGYARALLNEEVVASALAARRWSVAVDLMGVWLREAEEDERNRVRTRIAQLLPQVPSAELERIFDGRLSLGAPDDLTDNESDMRKLLARQLAAVAQERSDTRLAQHLMTAAGPLLGDQGDAVAQLAAGAGRARVEAPTVGLLISMRTDRTRRRSAEVAAGMSHGLGLPGSGARMVSRDGGGTPAEVQEALAGLAADGAAVLIAGVDDVEAAEAAAFAELQKIPVVLLQPPRRPIQPGGFVFVAGLAPPTAWDTLVTGLVERGATRIAMVHGGRRPDSAQSVNARTTNGPPASVVMSIACGEAVDATAWKGAAVDGAVVDGDADCARSVLAGTAGMSLRYAFGPEVSGVSLPTRSLLLTAGRFPIVARATEEEWLQAWQRQRYTPPSWWSGLGRDAGVLAWAGVQALPAQGTEDPQEVLARRVAARESLAAATAELWTTDARGFGGGRALPRQLGISEVKTATPGR